jgi:hypothetical protein
MMIEEGGRAESNCWDNASIAISIIGIINAAVMAAGTTTSPSCSRLQGLR